VALIVTDEATFGPLERRLAAHGPIVEARMAVVGEDCGSGADVGPRAFPVEAVPVPPGAASLAVRRRRPLRVDRRSLREAPGPVGQDEIGCRIDPAAIGLPTPLVSATTAEHVLARA
jgi:hypothetical protein